MATIRPFPGVRYNPGLIPDLSQVVTQPYDRIGTELRAQYLRQSPYSFVRLILTDADPHRPQTDNPYAATRELYDRWLQERSLVRSPRPAMYVYHQTFRLADGTSLTRRAFIAALQLTPFEEGTVLPHERTLSAPKADRLNLFRATQVSFEPIFVLYPDEGNQINAVLDAALAGLPPAAETCGNSCGRSQTPR